MSTHKPTQFAIGAKVRDIYSDKISTVSKVYWQWYAGGDTSDYTVEFAEGGWNKSTNLEPVKGSASVDTARAVTRADRPQKRQFSLIVEGKTIARLLAKDHHCAARQVRKHFWPKGQSAFNFTISPHTFPSILESAENERRTLNE